MLIMHEKYGIISCNNIHSITPLEIVHAKYFHQENMYIKLRQRDMCQKEKTSLCALSRLFMAQNRTQHKDL